MPSEICGHRHVSKVTLLLKFGRFGLILAWKNSKLEISLKHLISYCFVQIRSECKCLKLFDFYEGTDIWFNTFNVLEQKL